MTTVLIIGLFSLSYELEVLLKQEGLSCKAISVKNLDQYNPKEHLVIVPYLSNFIREDLYNKAIKHGFKPFTYVSSNATYTSKYPPGAGSIIFPGVYVGYNTKIAIGTILMPNVVVSHDSVIEEYSYISPGVNIASFVTVSKNCFLGIGATIKPRIILPPSSKLGAGANLTKNFTIKSTFIGNPAKNI